ncbi:hypothetical protein BSY18_3819 (plasmid) [Blastomonas sp. RAC04]|nr:hypothetical protein BSY18_3819 [Blastomonas sp. RAC04]
MRGDHLFVGRGGRNARRTPRVSANAAGCERLLNRDVPATDSIGTIPAKLPNATYELRSSTESIRTAGRRDFEDLLCMIAQLAVRSDVAIERRAARAFCTARESRGIPSAGKF